MFFLLATGIIFIITIFVIFKFKLDWLRILILIILPSTLLALYMVIVEIKNFSYIFETLGSIFIISLMFMLPALFVFSVFILLLEKKFKLNFFVLMIVSIIVGGLSASPYIFDSSAIGTEAFTVALITAPIAVFIERKFYEWRKNVYK